MLFSPKHKLVFIKEKQRSVFFLERNSKENSVQKTNKKYVNINCTFIRYFIGSNNPIGGMVITEMTRYEISNGIRLFSLVCPSDGIEPRHSHTQIGAIPL